ncbi:MAG: Asp-tRNA(Asn)/Glu-tRNA(Gln) amidotransferase subunit GatA [Xanthomonadaceae bacterium]|nr:Asp-tRNA(Asn)/Glu-tRNA(Gln) amidotransferase subunit GatA [Xanthomonadaceae bacterium]
MHDKTIAELSAALAARELSAVELTQALLDRIEAHNGTLNAFITVTAEQALEQARRADERIAKGEAGALTGIPIAHKDNFCTAGVLTTCASRMLHNFVPPYDATVVARLEEAGVVMLGKTNMDEFAMGSSNETSYYGPVKNPWDTERVPGGSSGGSAAAVAAGLVPGATATDTGGSVRQPAAFCGVSGLKPTYGRVSRYGIVAFASSLDQASVIARSAEDLALLLQAMAGFDERDSTCVDLAVPDYRAGLEQPLDGVRIGLPREYFQDGVEPELAKVIEAAVEEYRRLGAEIKEVSLPHNALAVAAYHVIAPAEASSNLARFDGVRYGYRCENPRDLEDLYMRSRGEGFGTEVKRRLLIGTRALLAEYYQDAFLKAQKIRRLIHNDFIEAFKQVDVLLGPTTGAPAFRLGEKSADPVQMYLTDVFTIAANLAGLPALSLPAGQVDGLPVGMQLIGRHFDEARLLNLAHRFQQATDWHTVRPQNFE